MYPTCIATTHYGRSLVAEREIHPGSIVEKFAGSVIAGFAQVPEHEVRHAILIAPDQWMIPVTPARYINHACAPNCRVNDDLEVVAQRTIHAGDEITISYNHAAPGESLPDWDPRWTFECQCGSPHCQGTIEGWECLST